MDNLLGLRIRKLILRTPPLLEDLVVLPMLFNHLIRLSRASKSKAVTVHQLWVVTYSGVKLAVVKHLLYKIRYFC